MENNSKKDMFSNKEKSKTPLIAIVLILIIASVGAYMWVSSQNTSQEASYFGEPLAEARSYVGKVVGMTEIEPVVEDGEIKFPLETVDEHDIVSFELENDEGFLVPLMAYITPTGRLFVGSSMCEPCLGRTFSLAGATLLCDKCKTTYTIEDHEFISGSTACGAYPPVNMNPVVEDGMITVSLDEVLNWRIRAY